MFTLCRPSMLCIDFVTMPLVLARFLNDCNYLIVVKSDSKSDTNFFGNLLAIHYHPNWKLPRCKGRYVYIKTNCLTFPFQFSQSKALAAVVNQMNLLRYNYLFSYWIHVHGTDSTDLVQTMEDYSNLQRQYLKA